MVWQRPFFSGVLFLLALFFTILYESLFSICSNDFDFMIYFIRGMVGYRIAWYRIVWCIELYSILRFCALFCENFSFILGSLTTAIVDLSLLIFRHCYRYWYSWFFFMRVYISFYNTSPLHSTTKDCYFLRLVNIFFFVCLTFFLVK